MIRRFFRTGPPIVTTPAVAVQEKDPAPHTSDRLRDDLRAWLGALELREAYRHQDAVLVSLELGAGTGRPYTLLHEAIAAGSASVNEQGTGSVNNLSITNRGSEPLLVLEGEIVVGAKQNRTITETLLVAASATVPVRVGCVERGRWDRAERPFTSGSHSMEPSCRRSTIKEMAVSGSVNQARLWRDVDQRGTDFCEASPTGDYHQMSHARTVSESGKLGDVPDSPTRVGMMVLLGERFVGLDVVSHPRTWAALSPRLLPSYFVGLDVMRRHPDLLRSTARATPAEWLSAATLSEVQAAPSAGLGDRVLVRSSTMNGAGLWHEGCPAHLAIFAD